MDKDFMMPPGSHPLGEAVISQGREAMAASIFPQIRRPLFSTPLTAVIQLSFIKSIQIETFCPQEIEKCGQDVFLFLEYSIDKKSCHFILTNKVVNDMIKMTRKVVKNLIRKRRDETMPLYNNLKEHRTALGINQTELGKMAGVSRQTISLIERGDYSPSVALALKLAKICQVTVEDIFVYEEDES